MLFDDHDIITSQLSYTEYGIPVNLYELCNYCQAGFCTDGLRAKYWKLFLDYTPHNKYKVENFYSKRRQLYTEYKLIHSNTVPPAIDNDMRRLIFFPNGNLCAFLDSNGKCGLTHREILCRILSVYSDINCSTGYVQGMHKILFPLYYVIVTSRSDEEHAEADVFFCFVNLIAELSELFMSVCDNDSTGLNGRLRQVLKIVKIFDPSLYTIMKKKGLCKVKIHLRWVSLFFSAEFEINELILLWDRVLADRKRIEILLYLAAAVFITEKELIETQPFDVIINKLQNQKKNSIELFNCAQTIRKTVNKKF